MSALRFIVGWFALSCVVVPFVGRWLRSRRLPRAADVDVAGLLLRLATCREQARKDAITIAAQGRAIRDLKAQVAELRAQLAGAGALDVRGEGR